jgi:hypothetical protein
VLLIYTHKITPRNRYAFNLIFKDILKLDFLFTSDVDVFKKHTDAKLSYSYQPIGDELFIMSTDLLFETGVKDQPISVFNYRDSKAFFATRKTSAFPFDIFAASFYLVTRFEEYLPHIRDVHNRFEAKNSLAYMNGFLQKPLVNTYALWIKTLLKEHFPTFLFPALTYTFVSTIDIDNAYAYREKGFVRNLGGYARAIASFNMQEVIDRTLVLLHLRDDPFDTYSFQVKLMKEYDFKCIYFFLLGDYGVNDKNVSVERPRFQHLIKTLGDYAQIGIHPSYGSNDNPSKLKKEIGRLSKVLHREIFHSRQHFLKLSLPDTYRNLIDADITNDYTMGYATDIGFRASICTSFYFYDLDMETETNLKVHPFAMMEGALKYAMRVKPDMAMTFITPIINDVKAVDGTFMSLWHNESMNESKLWRGWKNVYREMVKYATSKV